jgi:serine/threonine protein kinase
LPEELKVPATVLGRRVRCPRCGYAFQAESTHTGASASAEGPTEEPDELVGKSLGQYRLLRKLGRGGRGVVYEAEDTLLGRSAAVKVLLPEVMSARPDSLARFMLEARAASKLEHPNCVGIFGIEKQDGLVFIAMPLVRGKSAMELVKQYGALDALEATRICRMAARGLAAAHALHLVHRDVKPDNIMVAVGGEVKVADFGMVKMTDDAIAAITEPGKWLGTPYYMSPEQCQGEPVDGRSDVYALGATYYCLLAGRPPFWGLAPMKVVYKQVTDDPESVQEINPKVPLICSKVIERAMAKLPQDRYPTAEKMAAALENIEQSLRQAVTGRRQNLSDEPSSSEIDVLIEQGLSPSSGADAEEARRAAAGRRDPDSQDESNGFGTSLENAAGSTDDAERAGAGRSVSVMLKLGFASVAEAKGAWRLVRKAIRETCGPEFGEAAGPAGRKGGYLRVAVTRPAPEIKRMVGTLQYAEGKLLELRSPDREAEQWLRQNVAAAPVE